MLSSIQTIIKYVFVKHLLKVDYFLQKSTNVQAILVSMAALVKTGLADTFVSALQVTQEQPAKPVSNYIRDIYPQKAGPVYMEGGLPWLSSNITRLYVKFLTRVANRYARVIKTCRSVDKLTSSK